MVKFGLRNFPACQAHEKKWLFKLLLDSHMLHELGNISEYIIF